MSRYCRQDVILNIQVFEKMLPWLNKENRRKPIAVKLGRNSPCKCGSGKKFKNCCLKRVEAYKRSISSIQLCYCVGFGKVVDVPEPNIEQIKEELEKEYS